MGGFCGFLGQFTGLNAVSLLPVGVLSLGNSFSTFQEARAALSRTGHAFHLLDINAGQPAAIIRLARGGGIAGVAWKLVSIPECRQAIKLIPLRFMDALKLWLLLMGCCLILPFSSPAQDTIPADQFLESVQNWVQENVDDSVWEALGLDQARVQQFMAELQK